jgi:hypothetical protein
MVEVRLARVLLALSVVLVKGAQVGVNPINHKGGLNNVLVRT